MPAAVVRAITPPIPVRMPAAVAIAVTPPIPVRMPAAVAIAVMAPLTITAPGDVAAAPFTIAAAFTEGLPAAAAAVRPIAIAVLFFHQDREVGPGRHLRAVFRRR